MGRIFIYVLVLAGVVATQRTCLGQSSPNPATPQHPIDTRPEGQAPTCTYSASRTNGQTTGTTTCPAQGPTSAGKRFPYPGEPGETNSPGEKSNAATDPAQTSQPQTTAKRFPYPGDSGASSQSSPLKDAGSSGESTSSSGSSSSSSDSGLPPDEGAPDSPDALPAPKRARRKLPPVPRQTPDEREQEDVRIASFYQNDGNYRAAYMRAKDAVTLADDDPDAQFALAEAARKLGKLDEAEKSYKRCLDLDPLPKLRKASEKALKEMSGS